MTEEARKLAREVRERCAAVVESCSDFAVTSSTPGPEATPEALATASMRWLVSSLAKQIREDDAILALTPSHEAGTHQQESEVQVLNAIRDALEIRGYFHMANGRDIGILLDAISAGTQEPVASVQHRADYLMEQLDRLGAHITWTACKKLVEGLAALASQDATREALTEDEVMKIITKNFGGKMWESLTRNAWKDGIEIAYPTYAVVHFVGDIIDALASPARADDGEKAAFPNKSCQSNGEEA